MSSSYRTKPRRPWPLVVTMLPAAGLLGWAACGDSQAPPADTGDAPVVSSPAAAPADSVPEPFVEHTVGEGETLWDIARAYDLHVSDVMEANELRPRDVRRLGKGRVLRIPGATSRVEVATAADRARAREELPPLDDGAYHVLAAGETLWDLARTYDKSVDDIVARNELTDDDVRSLSAGRSIIIPGIDAGDVRAVVARRSAEGPSQRNGITHEVAPGETVWAIANAFQVGVSQIMAANGLDESEVTALRPGARLFLPGVTADRRGRVRRQESPEENRANGLARRLGLGDRRAASSLLRGRVERRWLAAAGGNRLPGTLRWPVANGWFVRGYGSGEGGYHLATDIAGEIGWNVRAAAPGIVGYSGNEVSGYGNMVLVVHPGGWVTMYAHNSTNFVVAGQRVSRGAILAEVGSTGISRGPHVHFELLFDGRNCDPAALFRPGIRHRSGRHTPLEHLTWSRDKPSSIRCAPRRRHPRSQWVINE
jgi:murein DD-endopeptidase MepM/ murein hydrolase activator NlpD